MASVKTGIVMMNLGGPATLDQVEPFLLELFADREIIKLPFQSWLGPFIAHRRAPKVRGLYAAIGGGSPILRYTTAQGQGMVERLDRLSPDTAPHGFYVAFRYVKPTSDDALRSMAADGVERAVAFSQYPQFSCSTTGSSLNELWRALDRTGLRDAFDWSVIDRWPVHPGFISAMTATVREGLERFPPETRDRALILFSAHSLPLHTIDRGDPYPQEIGASVQRVVERLAAPNPYLLAYQSEVGPVRWLGPHTEQIIRMLGDTGAERRARGPDRLYERPHRNAVGAGPGVRSGGTDGRDHQLSSGAGPQRPVRFPRCARRHRARASRLRATLLHPVPRSLPGLRQRRLSSDSPRPNRG